MCDRCDVELYLLLSCHVLLCQYLVEVPAGLGLLPRHPPGPPAAQLGVVADVARAGGRVGDALPRHLVALPTPSLGIVIFKCQEFEKKFCAF